MDTSIVVPITAHVPAQPTREESPAEREIARLRARVRELSAELVHAQEAACHRMARELHDRNAPLR
jgi:signal transduction histidine kinase